MLLVAAWILNLSVNLFFIYSKYLELAWHSNESLRQLLDPSIFLSQAKNITLGLHIDGLRSPDRSPFKLLISLISGKYRRYIAWIMRHDAQLKLKFTFILAINPSMATFPFPSWNPSPWFGKKLLEILGCAIDSFVWNNFQSELISRFLTC